MKLLLRLGILLALLSACVSTPTSTPRPTITATKTLPPSPTRTPRPTFLNACVTNATIRIRGGPGTQYEVIGGLASGTCLSVIGRNHDSTWVYIRADDNKTGWVAAWLLTIDGDINRLSVRSVSEVSHVAPTAKLPPTATHRPIIFSTSTPRPVVIPSVLLCSQTANKIGEFVSCKIERAYCDYFPSVDGSPTFCNDRPYPNQNFALVVFGEDWSDYDGDCIIVSGTVSRYRGVPQILATNRSQVSYCE